VFFLPGNNTMPYGKEPACQCMRRKRDFKGKETPEWQSKECWQTEKTQSTQGLGDEGARGGLTMECPDCWTSF